MTMMLMIRRIILFCIGLYIALIGFLFVGQRSMMYHPNQNLPAPTATKIPEMAVSHVKTSDGYTNVMWSYLPKSAPYTIVFFHGNAKNIAARDFKVRPLIDAGYGVVLVEYRGFGGNSGSPSETGLMTDSRAAINDLSKNQGIPISQMIFYGESLGTGVATRMASEYKNIAGLILEVPFDSTLAVAQQTYPFVLGLSYLMHDQYRSDTLIGGLKMPKLIMVAGKDQVVPPEHARRLFDLAAAPKKKIEFPDGQHLTLYNLGAEKVVLKFIKTIKSSVSPISKTKTIEKTDSLASVDLPNTLATLEPAAAALDMVKNIPDPLNDKPSIMLKSEPIKIISAGHTRAEISVELATRPADQERGLQNRKSLDSDHGMLFIFQNNVVANFWMKDTLIPLDMIFIDQDGRIIKIHENAKPLDETIITSQFQARAVLELNAGAVQHYGLSMGDLVLSPTLDQTVTASMALNN